ncbi:aspartic peptidase domain-containing protein [Gautieria morchelliformis]|nr:aspartic peptidase domain-containing protein [Gautieria morchelliformis]
MMFLSRLSLSLGFVYLSLVCASPALQIRNSPISLPIAAQVNATGGTVGLQNAERARFSTIRSPNVQRSRGVQTRAFAPVTVTDTSVIYVADVGVGSPPTQYSLIVDTGSSNTWVGARKPYNPTSTSHKTSEKVLVKYGSGNFSGDEYTDTVTLGSASIKAQSIGVASSFQGFSGVHGVLGLGPQDLTLGTLSPSSSQTIPTVTDNLKTQGLISAESLGVSLEPTTQVNQTNGQLDFGGTDSSKFTGSIEYVDVTTVPQASRYWGVTQSIMYGSKTPISIIPASRPVPGIVDTGTTLLYLPTDAFNRYQAATGGKPDSRTGLLKISESQYSNLESLFFTIGDITLEYTRNAQIWPRSQNVLIGGSINSIYLVVADSGVSSGSSTGLDFVNGFVWLQRFYTVFDSDNRRIGFASTPFTNARTN